MFSWLSGKIGNKSSHSLGSEDGIAQVLGELTPGRPEICLHDIADNLQDPAQILAAMTPEAFKHAVSRLDEAAQPFLEAVWNLFLAENRLDYIAEQRLKAIDTVSGALIEANMLALRQMNIKPALGGKTPFVPGSELAQRAMRALVTRLRLARLHYRAPDSAWWHAANDIMALAKHLGGLNHKCRAYPADAAPSSPWIEYLLALFFETAPLGNFNPQQMDLLYRLLRWLEPHFMVRDTYSEQSKWFVRLGVPDKPAKADHSQTGTDTYVYFGAGLALGHLIKLRSTVAHGAELPDWIAASHCNKDSALIVIDSLVMHWSERPPQRTAARENREANLLACNGFTTMRRMIALSEFARSGRKVGYKSNFEMAKFDRRMFADLAEEAPEDETRWLTATPLETLRMLETGGDKQMMDEWKLQDVSASGLGAMAPFLRPWMVVGAYFAYRLDDEIDWRVGLLRRIHRTDSGHPSLGVQSFPDVPACAAVRSINVFPGSTPQAEVERESGGQQYQDAILLSLSHNQLMAAPGTFREDAYLALAYGGQREAVRMKTLIHSGSDCETIEFEYCDKE